MNPAGSFRQARLQASSRTARSRTSPAAGFPRNAQSRRRRKHNGRRALERGARRQARHDRVRRGGGQTRAGRGHDEVTDQRVAAGCATSGPPGKEIILSFAPRAERRRFPAVSPFGPPHRKVMLPLDVEPSTPSRAFSTRIRRVSSRSSHRTISAARPARPTLSVQPHDHAARRQRRAGSELDRRCRRRQHHARARALDDVAQVLHEARVYDVRLSVRSKGRERAGQSSRVSFGKTPSRFGPFRAGARKRTVGCLSTDPDREALLLLKKTDPPFSRGCARSETRIVRESVGIGDARVPSRRERGTDIQEQHAHRVDAHTL